MRLHKQMTGGGTGYGHTLAYMYAHRQAGERGFHQHLPTLSDYQTACCLQFAVVMLKAHWHFEQASEGDRNRYRNRYLKEARTANTRWTYTPILRTGCECATPFSALAGLFLSIIHFSPHPIIVPVVVCPTGPHPPLRRARRPNRGVTQERGGWTPSCGTCL